MLPNEIPNKLYFKIGEVAHLVGVEPYVLRYWETEFPDIHPVKSKTNQRLYRRKDLETVLKIRTLLYKEGFTIEGARKRIREIPKLEKSFEQGLRRREGLLEDLKKGLEDVARLLKP